MATRIDAHITLVKYGDRAYHVMIDNEHWGNVCGYTDWNSPTVFWTATWFESPGGDVGGKAENFVTRYLAVAEVRIQTAPDRRK